MKMKNRKATGSLRMIIDNRSSEGLRKTENRMGISSKIYESIKANNLTLEEFANMMDEGVSEIEHWLDGTYNSKMDTLSKIEISLNIKLLDTKL